MRRNDLNPVTAAAVRYLDTRRRARSPIRIQEECNVLHLPIREMLLERNIQSFEPRACLYHIIHRDGNVAKPPAGLSVSTGIAREIRV